MTQSPMLVSSFTDDQREIADVAMQVLGAHSDSATVGHDLGWYGIGISEDQGGSGGSLRDLAPILEAVGAHLSPSSLPATSAIAQVVAASNPTLPELLEPLLEGRISPLVPIGEGRGNAIIERSRGRRLVRAKFLALGDSNGGLVLPVGRHNDSTLLYFPDGASAYRPEEVESFDLTRRYAEVDIRGIPESDGLRIGGAEAVELLDARLAVIAALDAIGLARDALTRTVSHSLSREQFGRPIGSFQAYKHRCATMFVDLKLAQSVTMRAVNELDLDGQASLIPAAATFAINAAKDICSSAIQLHGAIGMTWEYGIHNNLRRVLADHALARSSELESRLLTCARPTKVFAAASR